LSAWKRSREKQQRWFNGFANYLIILETEAYHPGKKETIRRSYRDVQDPER